MLLIQDAFEWETASWEDAEAFARRITDGIGYPIDAGILAPVVGLNLLGFYTSASCEGHLNWGYPFPWIEFYQQMDNADYTQICERLSEQV